MSLIFNRSPPLSEDWQLPALLRWHFEHPRKTSSSNTVCQRPADVTKLSLIPRELEWRWIQGVKFFILIVINWNWISLESYAFAGERLGVGGLQNTDAGFVVEVKCFGYLQEDFSQGSSFNPGVICFFFFLSSPSLWLVWGKRSPFSPATIFHYPSYLQPFFGSAFCILIDTRPQAKRSPEPPPPLPPSTLPSAWQVHPVSHTLLGCFQNCCFSAWGA